MFCTACGKYNPDGTKECKYCGCGYLTKTPTKKSNTSKHSVDKSGFGIVMSIFLGVIGLLIGWYSTYDTDERESFVSGWIKGFWIQLVIAIVLVAVILGIASCAGYSIYF